MNGLEIGILVVCGALFLVSLYSVVVITIRNERTLAMRTSMLQDILYASLHDLGNDNTWRYDKFNEVSYNTIMWKWWKPLKPEAFYDDTSFLEVGSEKPTGTS